MLQCEYPYFRHNINELSVPRNIFEKNITIAKKKTISYKRGPIKIAQPNSNPNSNSNSDTEDQPKTGEKRSSHSSADRPSARRRKVSTSSREVEMEEVSFIDKVRRDKEMKRDKVVQPSSTNPNKTSIAEYRASRGLPPIVSNTSQRIPPPVRTNNNSAGSSLFIKKKPSVSRPKPTNSLHEGLGAKEIAQMEVSLFYHCLLDRKKWI